MKGVDEALANANSGDKLSITVTPDKGFGEREPSKVRMIAQRKLGEKADEVGVGDEIELDQRRGTVRYIGSGRVQVDFNQQYAGRVLVYEANILKTVDSTAEKAFQLINRRIPIDEKSIDIKSDISTMKVSYQERVIYWRDYKLSKERSQMIFSNLSKKLKLSIL